ncbi:MAG: hypothetical protein ACFFB3_14625 [Candidatus Hodarchaeota archaeon]
MTTFQHTLAFITVRSDGSFSNSVNGSVQLIFNQEDMEFGSSGDKAIYNSSDSLADTSITFNVTVLELTSSAALAFELFYYATCDPNKSALSEGRGVWFEGSIDYTTQQLAEGDQFDFFLQ